MWAYSRINFSASSSQYTSGIGVIEYQFGDSSICANISAAFSSPAIITREGVGVGVFVAVGVGVFVAVGVGVLVAVGVGVLVAVGVGVCVAVGVGVCVDVGTGVLVAVGIGVEVFVNAGSGVLVTISRSDVFESTSGETDTSSPKEPSTLSSTPGITVGVGSSADINVFEHADKPPTNNAIITTRTHFCNIAFILL